MDVFKEQLVKKIPSTKDKLQGASYYFLAIVVTLFSFLILPQFAIFIAAAVFFGAYYLNTFLKIEYEYIFTNGEIDIDVIYNRIRRKKKVNFDVKNIELMTYIGNEKAAHTLSNTEVTMDCSSGVNTDKTYAIVIPIKGKKTKLLVEPNEKLLECFENKLNRLTFIKKP
ncbi:MAG: DUF6106 family protein [Lachnospirales bacterium]